MADDTFAAWQAEATPDEATVHVCLNRRVYREFLEAAAALERVQPPADGDGGQALLDDGVDDAQVQELIRRVVDAEQAVREAERPLTFRCLPFEQWKALGDAHPPTDAQREANRYEDINEDTFWPAAIAASCVSPGLTVEQAVWLRDGDDNWPGLPREKWWEIVGVVRQVNVGGSSIPKSVLSTVAPLRRVLSSITPPDGASPSRSSEDGS